MLSESGDQSARVVLVDGHSLLHRAFYALPTLTTSQGEFTNAVYGFTMMLLRLLEDEKPDYAAVAFDKAAPTFRHEQFADYKGHRPRMPDELVSQVPLAKKVVAALSIPIVELDGYEADDIIGTLARVNKTRGRRVLIVTGDKDCLQLVDDNTTALITRRGIKDMEIYDVEKVQEKLGVKPEQVVDLKGLMGDSSDNIPGVPGIGAKTAVRLLRDYGSLENILQHVNELKGKVKENLKAYADQARLSQSLARIHCDVPLEVDLPPYSRDSWQDDKLYELFTRLEFKNFLSKLRVRAGSHSDEEDGTGIVKVTEKAQKLIDYRLLQSGVEIEEFITSLAKDAPLYLDPFFAEADTIDVFLVGMAISDGKRGGFVTLAQARKEAENQAAALPPALLQILQDENRPKVCFNAKPLFHALHNLGIKLGGLEFDLSLAAYLLNPGQNTGGLADLVLQFFDEFLPPLSELVGKGARTVPLSQVDPETLADFARPRLGYLVPLRDKLEKKLEELELKKLYYDLEMPLVPVLASMEQRGITVDVQELERISDELADRITALTQQIYDAAGTEFNINSPKQMGEILFQRLQLPVIKKTKTGPSTSAKVLEELAAEHEIARLILDYRQLVKLKSTYLDALKTLVHPDTGRVHTTFHQTATATGRLSSSNPNLQNIPVRTEEGRRIRRAFIPGSPDHVLLTADYSQIELRVLAHISRDETLIEAFQAGMDIHRRTAAEVMGLKLEDVTPEMRSAAKAINFGIVYGISSFGLARNTGLTRQQAQEYIDKYFQKYSGVKAYLDEAVRQAREQGYVTTLFHRRRYLPDINSRRPALRKFAERMAMNTPIQGTAADIIKMAMVEVERRLLASDLPAQMLLQVHDELVLEVHKDELESVARLVKEIMEGVTTLAVPLIVDVKAGSNWRDVAPLEGI